MALSPLLTPRETLIARVRSWSGIKIQHANGLSHILLKDRPIGRFPSDDSLEAVLCGTLRGKMIDDIFDLPDGVWPTDDQHRVLIDLTTPAGFEEAIRVLLNAYLSAQAATPADWYLADAELVADPACRKATEIIGSYRSARAMASV